MAKITTSRCDSNKVPPNSLMIPKASPPRSAPGIDVLATTVQARAACPQCGTESATVHSRYTRTVGDLPWGKTRVVLHLRPRRFRCHAGACRQRIFCERLPRVTRVHGRQTH